MTADRDSTADRDPADEGEAHEQRDSTARPARPLSVLIAGGGTAGHIEPAMNTADALRVLQPDVRIVALGTPKGLENTLVPQRGYQLALVPPVPLPRKPSLDLVKLPGRLRTAVRQTRVIIAEHDVQVVIGFGGYVCLPAYLAARGRVPIVVHEANARAGLANKVGARFAARVLAAVDNSGLPRAEVIGIPVRSTIAGLDRAALRAEAREFFGLDPDAPTLLAFGGSQGAVRINEAVSGAAAAFAAAGIGVLHAHGRKNVVTVEQVPGSPPYVAVPYVDRMDLAYAAADLALGRSGAMTVAELGAVGLPAVYVPLPHGNGEQRLNAADQLAAGSAIAIDDADLTAATIASTVIPLLTDRVRREAMTTAAARTARPDVAAEVARIVADAAAGAGRPS